MSYNRALKTVRETLKIKESESEKILEKAETGGEIIDSNYGEWLDERFIPNIVFLALVESTGILPSCITPVSFPL